MKGIFSSAWKYGMETKFMLDKLWFFQKKERINCRKKEDYEFFIWVKAICKFSS